MAKNKETAQAAEAPAPVAPVPVEAAPQQPVQQYYQQPVYVPRPPKKAAHPAVELGLAIFSVLASAWLFIDALTGTIKAFGGRLHDYDFFTSIAVTHLGGYGGIVVSSLLAVLFASFALVLFRRSNDALEKDEYKGIAQAGAAIVIVKTLILGGTTVGVGLTPLLTIQKGLSVGPTYLYDFLPLFVSTGLFVFVSWYLIKLVGRQKVGALLSTVLLIATSVVLVLGLVAVIVKSHSKSSRYTPSTSESRNSSSSSDRNDSGSSDRTDSGSFEREQSSSNNSYSKCYDEYKKTEDVSAYSDCLQDVYDYDY